MTNEAVLSSDTGETSRTNLARIATIAVAAFLSLLGAIRYGIHPETLELIVQRSEAATHPLAIPLWLAVLSLIAIAITLLARAI